MEVHSLGYRTDLIFAAFDGEIHERGDFMVIRTPSNPGFYWGNFLLFAHPPAPGDHVRWRRLFAEEIGTPPVVLHETFGWDTIDGASGDVQPFLDAGFQLDRSQVLTTDNVRPPRHRASGLTVRTLTSESEWETALLNQIRCRPEEHEESAYRLFKERQMARYREMSAAGRGQWYGGFLEGRLVADLGIYRAGNVARFQSVETHPDYRRRGVGGTLVFEAARDALHRMGVSTLVMVAEERSPAARLYQTIGFQPAEIQVGLAKWAPAATGERASLSP